MTVKRKRGRISSTKSDTRSARLKGRKSNRLGRKCVPKCSQTQGLPVRPIPAVAAKHLPRDVFHVVVKSHAEMTFGAIHGKLLPYRCDDCDCRLSVDTYLERQASDMPERDGRPLRYICEQCFTHYAEYGPKAG